jgi:general nucleoside transport system permease protein
MVTWLHLLSLTLSKLTPLLMAAMGGLFSELSGVINFALEGMMLAGAFGAVWGSHVSGSPWIGLALGAISGMLIASLHALACLRFQANQIVSSIALNLLAAGLTGMLLNEVFGVYGTSPAVPALPKLSPAGLVIGPAAGTGAGLLAGLSIVVPLALVLSLAVIIVFRHTVPGLRIRACGESSLAAEAAGLATARIRFSAIVTGGALAGMAGAYLAIGELSQFIENMTHGRGYLAIAALILGRWRPVGVLLATSLFGFSEALSEWLSIGWPQFPSQLFLALPYAVCLLALISWVGRGHPPSDLGR